MKQRSLNQYLQPNMKIPQVDMTGCDILLWQEHGEIYWLEVGTGEVYTVRDSSLDLLLSAIPDSLSLCIMMDNGHVGRVSNCPLQ